MVTNKRKPLTVYKASAGSGKTFTLATEYIRLLIENPQSYRTILAVTFTNKATEEMKTRPQSAIRYLETVARLCQIHGCRAEEHWLRNGDDQ